MILVTGATGHFGNAAIHSLLERGVEARGIVALVRSENAAEEFKGKGIGAVVGDYDDYPSLVHAFSGVDKLLFVSGNDIGKRVAQHTNVVNAAKEAGVKHIVYTSFQRKTEDESSPLWMVAESHLYTENLIKASGMDYTLLKNNLYMDFLPGFIGEKVAETGMIYVPAEGGKVGAVLRSEMAEATAAVLAGDGHQNKEYHFSHSNAVSYSEIAKSLSGIFGKTVEYISPTVEEYKQTLTRFGVPAEGVGIFSGFASAQAQGELEVESNDIEVLLGRKPTSVHDFLSRVYATKA